MLPKAAQRQVAMVTEARSIPVCARMEGFTKMMYAIVMKVVAPARISVRQLVLCSAKWNQASRRVRIGRSLPGAEIESEWEQDTGAGRFATVHLSYHRYMTTPAA